MRGMSVVGAMVSALTALALTLSLAAVTSTANAQVGPGGLINPQRDCQTIRTCRFERGGTFRGCLSSYSCRSCRLVRARCEIGGRTQNCQEMVCGWGR